MDLTFGAEDTDLQLVTEGCIQVMRHARDGSDCSTFELNGERVVQLDPGLRRPRTEGVDSLGADLREPQSYSQGVRQGCLRVASARDLFHGPSRRVGLWSGHPVELSESPSSSSRMPESMCTLIPTTSPRPCSSSKRRAAT